MITKNGMVEVYVKSGRRGLQYMPMAMYETDFCLDLVTFKVLKHRWGINSCTPQQAYEWLTEYLESGTVRILLLVD